MEGNFSLVMESCVAAVINLRGSHRPPRAPPPRGRACSPLKLWGLVKTDGKGVFQYFL